jgi:hypothetical protein
MKRFISNTTHRKTNNTPTLGREEINATELSIIIEAQRLPFSMLRNELESGIRISAKHLARLCPFVDSVGTIRVGGRIRHSSLPYKQRHPILLPKTSHLSILIYRHWHKITCHSGPRVMSSLIHRRY